MTKKNQNSSAKSSATTKILGREISDAQKQKLVRWTIEGVIIGIISFFVMWIPFLNQS